MWLSLKEMKGIRVSNTRILDSTGNFVIMGEGCAIQGQGSFPALGSFFLSGISVGFLGRVRKKRKNLKVSSRIEDFLLCQPRMGPDQWYKSSS